MHPFDFTATIHFTCAEPDSSFVFNPEKNKFHWYGKTLDKIGSYSFSQSSKIKMELVWNYGREQDYIVVSFEGKGDAMTAFVLQNTQTGAQYSFSR